MRNLAIIGSGPAGLTAAIYTARADLRPLVLEGEPSPDGSDQPGGQLMLTTEVENFPGFRDGVMGPDLMREMRAQAERFGAELIGQRVVKTDLGNWPFRLWVGDGDATESSYTVKTVVLATGARALMLGVPGESELLGRGVSTCATCDGFFFKGHDIAVVGGGDSALEEAGFLSKFASSVTVIHRRKTLRASKIMQDRAMKNPRLSFRWNSEVVEAAEAAGKLGSVVLRDIETGSRDQLNVSGLFVAIGHRPNSDIVRGQIELDPDGYVLTAAGRTTTSVPGVFACGDVQDRTYRQAVTAAGSGCMAALDVEGWLAEHTG